MTANMEVAVKQFFSSPRFAVAGASADANKFGYKSKSDMLYESPLFYPFSTILNSLELITNSESSQFWPGTTSTHSP